MVSRFLIIALTRGNVAILAVTARIVIILAPVVVSAVNPLTLTHFYQFLSFDELIIAYLGGFVNPQYYSF